MDEGGGRDRPTDLKETRTLVEFAVAKSIFYTGRAWRRDFCEWTTARGGGSELFSWMTTRGRRRPPRRTRLLDDDFDVDENENENCDDSEEDDARIRDAICGSLRHCMYAGRDERLEALCDVAIAVMSRPESQHRQAADALGKVAALVPDEIRQGSFILQNT